MPTNIFSAAIAGALAGFMLRYFLDGYEVNGVGWIERTLGEMVSSAWFWAFAGAVAIGGIEALRWAWRRDQADALRKWAQLKQFEYRETRRKSGEDYRLQAFRKSTELRNQLVGTIDNLPVEIVDVTTQHKDSEGSKTFKQHTVAILRDSQARMPEFALQPRGLSGWLLESPSKNRIQISSTHLSPYERGIVARFNQKYFVQTLAVHRAEPVEGDPPATQPDSFQDLRDTLTVQVLQFLLEHPDWHIESRGGQLVIWKPGKVISASRRDNLLRNIRELHRRLLAHQEKRPASWAVNHH